MGIGMLLQPLKYNDLVETSYEPFSSYVLSTKILVEELLQCRQMSHSDHVVSEKPNMGLSQNVYLNLTLQFLANNYKSDPI